MGLSDWLRGIAAEAPGPPVTELPAQAPPPKLVPAWPVGAIRWTSAHAYTPNQQGHYSGGHHIVLEECFRRGRLHRARGDALCKPFRKFWGLATPGSDGPRWDFNPTCKACLAIAARHGIDLTPPPLVPEPEEHP